MSRDTTYQCTCVTCTGAVCCCCTHQGVTAPGKGQKSRSSCCVEAVTLPTHPVGKCAEFEIKSSVCLLFHMYSGLWCVCAQLRGWVGWGGEFPLLFQISARTNGSIMLHKSSGKTSLQSLGSGWLFCWHIEDAVPVEGLPIWKTERAYCLLPCALVGVRG